MRDAIVALVVLTSFVSHTFYTTLGYAVETAPLSLPQLIQELHRSNPDLRAARKRWEALQAKVPLSKGLPAPRIGVEFEQIPRGTVKFNKAEAMYQLIQSLPFPGKLSLRHQVAVKEAQVAAFSFKQKEWEVTSQLKSVYYDLFLADRELEIEQAQVIWLNQAAAIARTRYATGRGSQAEVLRAEAEVLEASNRVTILTHRRKALEAHINHLLNRPIDRSIGNPGPIPLVPVPSSPEKLLADALQQQPELLVAKFSAERAEAAWKLSKRELLPDLETMIELRDPPMGPIGPWDLSLGLVLPFWFWTKQQYGVKVALYDKESAEAFYQAMQNEGARRIHENWHEGTAAYTTALTYKEGVIPLARQAVSSAQAAYEAGRGSFVELLDALRALGEKERFYDQQLVALEQKMVMLEQSVGVPLRPENRGEGEKS